MLFVCKEKSANQRRAVRKKIPQPGLDGRFSGSSGTMAGVEEEREIDMIEIDLKLVWEKLGDIIGANYTEELVDNLFSRFCL